jgi:nitrite reductase/ring-hydroxylating ferredoxin subunit
MKHILGSYTQLQHDKKWRVILLDHPYLVALVGQQVYAIPDTCPHQDASLFQGQVIGDTVVCPLHHAKFNLTNGEIDPVSKMLYFDFGPEKITTYKAVIEADQIILEL